MSAEGSNDTVHTRTGLLVYPATTNNQLDNFANDSDVTDAINGSPAVLDYKATSLATQRSNVFVNYIRHYNGEYVQENEFSTSPKSLCDASRITSADKLKPADYIVHIPSGKVTDIPDGTTLDYKFSITHAMMMQDYNTEESACVFIGIIDEDLTLSTGQTLSAGVPLIVDMNTIRDENGNNENVQVKTKGTSGGIYLHGSDTDTYWGWDYDIVYYWISHPSECNGTTKFIKYEYVE